MTKAILLIFLAQTTRIPSRLVELKSASVKILFTLAVQRKQRKTGVYKVFRKGTSERPSPPGTGEIMLLPQPAVVVPCDLHKL